MSTDKKLLPMRAGSFMLEQMACCVKITHTRATELISPFECYSRYENPAEMFLTKLI